MDLDPHTGLLARRTFLRSAALLGTGAGVSGLVAACSDDGPTASGATWLRVDLTLPDTGTTSLDAMFDLNAEPGALVADLEFCGVSVMPTGEIVPHCVTVAREYATAVLRPVSGDLYRLEAGGIPQPVGAPFQIRLTERTIPGTDVVVVTGQVVDPSRPARANFSITCDSRLAPRGLVARRASAMAAEAPAHPAALIGLLAAWFIGIIIIVVIGMALCGYICLKVLTLPTRRSIGFRYGNWGHLCECHRQGTGG